MKIVGLPDELARFVQEVANSQSIKAAVQQADETTLHDGNGTSYRGVSVSLLATHDTDAEAQESPND